VEFGLFVMALVVVYLLPGPDMILLLETGARQGKSLALATAIGLAIARSFHVALSAVGLSVLFKTEPWTFDLVRYAGSAYLIWLGIGILRAKSDLVLADSGHPMTSITQHSIWQAVQQGLLTNLLNPKALLFCSVLLPQFIDPQIGSTILQFALLGIVLVMIGLVFDLFFSISGSWLGRFMRHSAGLLRLQRWIFGTLLVSFGVHLGFVR